MDTLAWLRKELEDADVDLCGSAGSVTRHPFGGS